MMIPNSRSGNRLTVTTMKQRSNGNSFNSNLSAGSNRSGDIRSNNGSNRNSYNYFKNKPQTNMFKNFFYRNDSRNPSYDGQLYDDDDVNDSEFDDDDRRWSKRSLNNGEIDWLKVCGFFSCFIFIALIIAMVIVFNRSNDLELAQSKMNKTINEEDQNRGASFYEKKPFCYSMIGVGCAGLIVFILWASGCLCDCCACEKKHGAAATGTHTVPGEKLLEGAAVVQTGGSTGIGLPTDHGAEEIVVVHAHGHREDSSTANSNIHQNVSTTNPSMILQPVHAAIHSERNVSTTANVDEIRKSQTAAISNDGDIDLTRNKHVDTASSELRINDDHGD